MHAGLKKKLNRNKKLRRKENKCTKSCGGSDDARARQQYLKRSDVARQYLMRSLIDETVAGLRKRDYSKRKIAEELDVPTIRVYDALKRTGIDEELYTE